MRFIRKELSPANKRQYLLALGRRDIELLLGEARQAYRYMPSTAPLREDRQRLNGIIKGLSEALKVAEADGDDYDRAPVAERQAYKDHKEENPLTDITRFEVIDHRPCNTCDGSGMRPVANTDLNSTRAVGYITCEGCRDRGRVFVAYDVEVESSIQDEGRTLKIFVDKRKPLAKKKPKLEQKRPSYMNEHLSDAFAFFIENLRTELKKKK